MWPIKVSKINSFLFIKKLYYIIQKINRFRTHFINNRYIWGFLGFLEYKNNKKIYQLAYCIFLINVIPLLYLPIYRFRINIVLIKKEYNGLLNIAFRRYSLALQPTLEAVWTRMFSSKSTLYIWKWIIADKRNLFNWIIKTGFECFVNFSKLINRYS